MTCLSLVRDNDRGAVTITYVLLFIAQVIYAQGFILAFMINAFLRKVFFGTLRAAELEVNDLCSFYFLFVLLNFFASFAFLFTGVSWTLIVTMIISLQHLVEKVWYAVTETCLAFTVFRDDFSPKFIALFTLLLFLKSFHWLAEDRVDYVSLNLLCMEYINICLIINIVCSFSFRWKEVQ